MLTLTYFITYLVDMSIWQQHLDTKSDEEITEVSSHEVSHSILTIGLVG